MNRSKQRGTAWETSIVNYLKENGAPYAERRALNGNADRGDVAGIPGVVLEAKAAARIDLAGWVTEAEQERVNDGAKVAAVWIKRRGKTSPGAGYVVLTGDALIHLLQAAGYLAAPSEEE
jgi:uncharacterized OB-fold protein